MDPNRPSDLPFAAEHEPDEVPPEVEQKYICAAIVLYKCKDRTSNTVRGLDDYTVAPVDIQSPLIRELIRPLLTDVGGTFLNGTMNLAVPFKSLFSRHQRIRESFGQLEDGSEEKQHLKLLVDCMDGLFREWGPTIRDRQSKGRIDAANLWVLYPKGEVVYSRHGGHDRAFEVEQLNDWRLTCCSLVFDGSLVGWESVDITLKQFTGSRKINELEAYPLRFHPEQKVLKEKLVKRGARALEYQDISLLDYDGQAHGRRQVPSYGPKD